MSSKGQIIDQLDNLAEVNEKLTNAVAESIEKIDTLTKLVSEMKEEIYNLKKIGSTNGDNAKPKKQKKAKDPNAPKRPTSGYFYFCAATRDSVKCQNPDMKQQKVIAELGRLWRELNEIEKEPFLIEAAEDTKRFQREKKIYEDHKITPPQSDAESEVESDAE